MKSVQTVAMMIIKDVSTEQLIYQKQQLDQELIASMIIHASILP